MTQTRGATGYFSGAAQEKITGGCKRGEISPRSSSLAAPIQEFVECKPHSSIVIVACDGETDLV